MSLAMRMALGAALVTTVSALAPDRTVAQATGSIRGRVVESGSGRGISDAQITVTGTTAGAVTNANGDFTIATAPVGQLTVAARRIGYTRRTQNVTVTAGGEVRADFELSQAPTQLEAIVTTGTAGAQEKRTIGNAISQVDVSDLTSKSTVTNVSQVLQAKSPGVFVAAGAGTPGVGSEITIRGYGSFTTNRPVVYIDGIRMDTDNLGNFGPSGAGTSQFSGQTTSALDLVNPQDIESIEVIKGPAAATLYGADAAGGVIQIITKKGTRGQQAVRWTGRYETGWNEWGVDIPVNYSTCTPARKLAVDAAGNPTWDRCQGVPDNAVITDSPLRDQFALRHGDVRNYSLSLRGGGDRYAFYISGDVIHDQGVFYNSHDDRRSLRTNFTFNPTNKVDFNVNVAYNRQFLRLPLGDEAANGLLLAASRGIPALSPPTSLSPQAREWRRGWSGIDPSTGNRYQNDTPSDRYIIGTTVNFTPFAWWRNRLTAGMDFRNARAEILSLPGDPDTPAGLHAIRSLNTYNYTLDYSGSFIAHLPREIESTTSVGSQVTSRRDERVDASGSQLPTREITTIGSALSLSGGNTFSENNSVGVYAQQQFGWKNRLFVTGAVRADDNSSFGSEFDRIIYPKASISYVASEEPALQRYFNAIRATNFRLRGAWGRAGRAPAPYSATQTYTSGRVALGTSSVGGILRTNTFGNPNLKPEKGEEYELGFDSDLLNGRAGLELTWYRKTMRDLLVPLALPPSLGFGGSMLQNLGKTRNQGIELSLRGTPLELANFVWEGSLNFSKNSNKLLLLDTLRTEEFPGGASYSPQMQRNRVGYPLGSYFLRYPSRTASGQYVLTPGGAPVYDTAFKYLGPAVPTKLASLSNTLTLFKNFRVYALLDYQGGHYLFNYKEYNRCALTSNGPNCELLNRAGISDTVRALYGTGGGTPTVLTSPMTQTLYVEKADFVKLRDVSLTFNVPERYAKRGFMQAASIVLSGRNLAMWTDYSGLDPEVNGYGNNVVRGSGNNSQFVRVDAYSAPMTRRYTLMLNLTY